MGDVLDAFQCYYLYGVENSVDLSDDFGDVITEAIISFSVIKILSDPSAYCLRI
jgi:hypothetical protein